MGSRKSISDKHLSPKEKTNIGLKKGKNFNDKKQNNDRHDFVSSKGKIGTENGEKKGDSKEITGKYTLSEVSNNKDIRQGKKNVNIGKENDLKRVNKDKMS